MKKLATLLVIGAVAFITPAAQAQKNWKKKESLTLSALLIL